MSKAIFHIWVSRKTILCVLIYVVAMRNIVMTSKKGMSSNSLCLNDWSVGSCVRYYITGTQLENPSLASNEPLSSFRALMSIILTYFTESYVPPCVSPTQPKFECKSSVFAAVYLSLIWRVVTGGGRWPVKVGTRIVSRPGQLVMTQTIADPSLHHLHQTFILCHFINRFIVRVWKYFIKGNPIFWKAFLDVIVRLIDYQCVEQENSTKHV